MDSNNSSSTKLDLYSIVTNRIIELLEQGTIPWQKPWKEAGIPMNLLSKRPYRGINLWLLLALDYSRNLFLTWDQLKKLGGSVKKGEHGHIVVFWKTLKKHADIEEEEKKRNTSLLRYYKVFNIEQCNDIPENLVEPATVSETDSITECEAIIKTMPQCPAIKHKESKAFYHIQDDYINMPKKKSFKIVEGYYSTLFHELVHSTGHEKRLNRSTITEMSEFGSDNYSLEELIAEIGTAYLSGTSGILKSEFENSAAYISSWLQHLKNDKRCIIRVAGNAQKAVEYILNQNDKEKNASQIEQSELLSD